MEERRTAGQTTDDVEERRTAGQTTDDVEERRTAGQATDDVEEHRIAGQTTDYVEELRTVGQATDENILWLMRFAYWINEATHSEYVILIAFPRQNWLSERTLMLRYTCIACLVMRKFHLPLQSLRNC